MGKKKVRTLPTLSLTTEIKALFLLLWSLLLSLSLYSFRPDHLEANWLGLFGYALAYGLHYLLGLSSNLLPLFLGWIAYASLRKLPARLSRQGLFFSTALLSLSLFCAVLGAQSFAFLEGPSRLTLSKQLPGFPPSFLHYLGGVPLYRLYVLPGSLQHLLGGFGTAILALTGLLLSLAGFFDLSLRALFRAIAQRMKRASLPKAPAPVRKKPSAAPPEFPTLSLPTDSPPALRVVEKPIPPLPKAPPAPRASGGFTFPPATLLAPPKKYDAQLLKKDLERSALLLEETLRSFGIEAKVGNIHTGPTITSFEVHPAVGVKVQRIKALENDIALNLQAKSLRILAPIPGKAAVGIEVPNPRPQEVSFREILESYQSSGKRWEVPLLLGKRVNGEEVMADLTKMPHLIIAGATGSGKSVCINTLVMSMVMNASPDKLRLLMVDPKKVELTSYSRLPHMVAPVITEPEEARAALLWLVKEMERRYEFFRLTGCRHIVAFNERKPDRAREAEHSIPEEMPYLVVLIDELADLMMVSASDIETPIARLAQMARAVGIHLILATQRPSREVITGLIKANFPTRIAFKVASRVNSQIILDDIGAETLLGNGDMLFLPPGGAHLLRAQGALVRDEEINRVIEFLAAQGAPEYLIPSFRAFQEALDEEESAERDPLYEQAKAIVLETGNASTTFLQRKLKIGYARAASVMDALEQHGVIGPQEGAKPRKIFHRKRDDEI